MDWEQVKKEAEKRKGVILEDDQLKTLTPENVDIFNQFAQAGTRENPVILALDELHLFFNSRDWAQTNAKKRGILELLTQVRKVNIHCIFITQSRHNLDKQFVRMIQYFWRCRDLEKWGIPIGSFRIKWPFKQILQICTQAENEKMVVKKVYIPKQQWVFGMYKTEALAKQLDVGFDVVEAKSLKKAEKKKRKRWKILLPTGFAFSVNPLVGVLGFKGEDKEGYGDESSLYSESASVETIEDENPLPIKPVSTFVSGCYKLGNKFYYKLSNQPRFLSVAFSSVTWYSPKDFEINGTKYTLRKDSVSSD